MKPLIWRRAARRDVADAAAWYVETADLRTGDRFLDAVETALAYLGRHPAAGSPRYAGPLRIDGLRCWPVKNFPYLVFYVERDAHLDVWRVLHAHRDIPAWMDPTPR
ncbi:type II toxin-antitoxin system RelE/ParE family toxin [Luteimonas kalidii]|uniref:Type II toxin-antitoxin system RelE/ParE family toxin n=1 Tax=Luteimonas kalidii TaxID=3042025 RepID=A0ABT6JVS8_9GAMM|nr:type II toxin-antitoxin system RelE/ParE family toxin [Luteimonas kalidii]MDH5834804.1 type II toxin-antitoxin system RelE/ParE family toxin [Luteimonas kalidii]